MVAIAVVAIVVVTEGGSHYGCGVWGNTHSATGGDGRRFEAMGGDGRRNREAKSGRAAHFGSSYADIRIGGESGKRNREAKSRGDIGSGNGFGIW